MLRTSSDFENSIEFLLSDAAEQMNKGVKYQEYTLKSDSFNSTFDAIEGRLNKLYEKTRVMEDVIKYAKAFLEQNIYDTTQECRSILNTLEDNRDKLKTNAYISYSVPLLEGSGSFTDRDNSILSHCVVNNSTLTLSGENETPAKIKSIERKVGFVPYKSNLSDLIDGKVYRAFYLVDGQVNGGLKEDIYVELDAPTIVNFIDILPSNCVMDNMRYIDDNGSTEYVDKYRNVISRDRKLKAIQFTLTSQLYTQAAYTVDQTRMASDFWDQVKEKEYDAAMGFTNLSDLDAAAGIDAFKAAYAAYQSSMQSWNSSRQAIASYNRSNGYSDSPATVVADMAPDAIEGVSEVNIVPTVHAQPYPTVEKISRYGLDPEEIPNDGGDA